METEESTAEGINVTVIQEDVTANDADGHVLRDTTDQGWLQSIKLLVELLRDPANQDDSDAGDDLEEICKLVKVICKLSESGLNEISKTEGDGPEELRRNATTQDVVAGDNDLEEIYESTQENY